MIIKTIWLHKINYVESIRFASFCISYSKVVPLSVTPSVVVWLKNQIILVLINLDGPSEITTFKTRLKQQRIVIRVLRYVEWGHFSISN